jgi:LPXTG-motif cell wall-anchored protein
MLAALLVALVASPAAAQYDPLTPGFVITPSITPPGQQVTAIGFGCPGGSTVVLTIAGTVLGTGTAAEDGQGSFTIDFTAPPNAGDYTVTVTCGEVTMTNTLTVVSSTTLPATGSGTTLPLARLGIGLLVAGAFIVLALRRRRDERPAPIRAG